MTKCMEIEMKQRIIKGKKTNTNLSHVYESHFDDSLIEMKTKHLDLNAMCKLQQQII